MTRSYFCGVYIYVIILFFCSLLLCIICMLTQCKHRNWNRSGHVTWLKYSRCSVCTSVETFLDHYDLAFSARESLAVPFTHGLGGKSGRPALVHHLYVLLGTEARVPEYWVVGLYCARRFPIARLTDLFKSAICWAWGVAHQEAETTEKINFVNYHCSSSLRGFTNNLFLVIFVFLFFSPLFLKCL